MTISTSFIAQTTIQSEHASKYLTVLCRHFARKVKAEWDDITGTVHFPVGVTTMRVDSSINQLEVTCTSDSKEQLEEQKLIISQHLDTYSRRETIDVVWRSV
ncbi:DUF2218 domain-containing protein [Vibrio lamellibrachiae]|uniref:DUF2218 domain-containing protein n=1 Tax=Vibrio lamellibrachiae TaxID=2910253 RepID=UPI003D115229